MSAFPGRTSSLGFLNESVVNERGVDIGNHSVVVLNLETNSLEFLATDFVTCRLVVGYLFRFLDFSLGALYGLGDVLQLLLELVDILLLKLADVLFFIGSGHIGGTVEVRSWG